MPAQELTIKERDQIYWRVVSKRLKSDAVSEAKGHAESNRQIQRRWRQFLREGGDETSAIDWEKFLTEWLPKIIALILMLIG